MTAQSDHRRAYKARYVFPIDADPIPDGIVVVEGNRIASVGKSCSNSELTDLGNTALLPGLVNSHTHLQFSTLTQPLGSPGMRFPNWIRLVVEGRRSDGTDDDLTRRRAIQQGMEECEKSGTVAVGEIATPSNPIDVYQDSTLDITVFLELIGLSNGRVDSLVESAEQYLSTSSETSGCVRPGISPHAPYTVHPELLRRVSELSAKKQIPIAMHLAESFEELELLESGTGPFRELLDDLGAWDATAIPIGTRPIDYLKMMKPAERVLVIHGNYFADDEITFLSQHRERFSVVYCPRSHAYFQHARYPLAKMIECGVNVSLGTDSRASNPDLNLFEEMRYVAQNHSEVPLRKTLEMGTIAAAKALGIENELGSLTIGKRSVFAAVQLPDHDCGDPFEQLFDTASGNPRLIVG